MSAAELNNTGMLCLAHVGDAVYELLVRAMVCRQGPMQVVETHRRTIALVNAPAQAKAAGIISGMLTEEESAIYRRGRNTKVNSVPHNATIGDYHAATGLEALFGWLYMQGRSDRLNELFEAVMEGMRDAT